MDVNDLVVTVTDGIDWDFESAASASPAILAFVINKLAPSAKRRQSPWRM
jgi:hypothetical protein